MNRILLISDNPCRSRGLAQDCSSAIARRAVTIAFGPAGR
jgi:hypothetical protein